jgi:hypothetical protein
LLVLLNAAFPFFHVTREEDHDRVKIRARKMAYPVIRMIRTGVAEDGGAGRHPLTKLFRERRQGGVLDPQGAQAVPRERDGDPAGIDVAAGVEYVAPTDPINDAGQPGATLIRPAKAEEAVSCGERPRPRQQEVLNIVKFEHRRLQMASMQSLHLVEH